MHHTLNKRDTYAKAIHEQDPIEEELSWGHTGTQEQLPTPPDERRRPTLTRTQKRIRAINRGDKYWTPGCGIILSVDEH